MAGGGSIQSMLTTLRENKKLLPKRKNIFKNKAEIQRLKDYYKKHPQDLLKDKTTTKEERAKIRQRVLKGRKRDTRIQLITVGIISLLIVAGSLYLIDKMEARKAEQEKAQQDLIFKEKEIKYNENMAEGRNQMEKEQWFFAAGYFRKALSFIPQDPKAEYNLAKAYSLLCYNKKAACAEACEMIDNLIKKYPESKEYKALKSKYLITEKIEK